MGKGQRGNVGVAADIQFSSSTFHNTLGIGQFHGGLGRFSLRRKDQNGSAAEGAGGGASVFQGVHHGGGVGAVDQGALTGQGYTPRLIVPAGAVLPLEGGQMPPPVFRRGAVGKVLGGQEEVPILRPQFFGEPVDQLKALAG